MRRQEMFDAAYTGLAAQGFVQSKGPIGCAYRGLDGLKCGVGHLIPDEKYTEDFEGLAADVPEITHAAGIDDSNIGLALDIQGAHDGHDADFNVTPMEMKGRLAVVAYRHGLTVPQVSA